MNWVAAFAVFFLPAQTALGEPPLWIRLRTAVSSVDGPPQAEVIAVVVGSGSRIPAGAIVTGRVEGPKDRRRLRLSFVRVRVGGVDYPFRARVLEVDNAREKVTGDGTILAMERLRKRPGKVELLLLAAAHAHPMALALLEGSKLALREMERPSVHYPVGTDLALRLESAPVLTANEPVVPVAPAALAAVLRTLPSRTETFRTQRPSDWVNLVFAGTGEQIAKAFEAGGWTAADQLSMRAGFKAFLAATERHSYRHAPVSRLAIAGRLPALVYEKQTNTFAKRHHIRIWPTEGTWKGQPLWVAAATHDIGIDFSTSSKTFTHKVDANVDAERQKVIGDLRFAGAVAFSYSMARPEVPRESHNGTGDAVRTDGMLVILGLSAP